MKPLITLHNVSANYDGNIVLSNVNLTVYEHDFLGIIGPNGGGKTTLAKLILGLIPPASGHINYYKNGEEVSSIRMGYLPQYSHIDRKFPISVEDTILSGLNHQSGLFSRYTQPLREKAASIIRQVGLDGMEKRSLAELSGGQLQRVLLGRALVAQPDIVILDEPTTYLDRRFEADLYQLLEQINNQCAIILISHDIGTVLQSVRSIACVSGTLDYHPSTTAVTAEWIENHFGCPIDLLGHGHLPHRVLACHHKH